MSSDQIKNSGMVLSLTEDQDARRKRLHARQTVCAWALSLPKEDQVEAAREVFDMLGLRERSASEEMRIKRLHRGRSL